MYSSSAPAGSCWSPGVVASELDTCVMSFRCGFARLAGYVQSRAAPGRGRPNYTVRLHSFTEPRAPGQSRGVRSCPYRPRRARTASRAVHDLVDPRGHARTYTGCEPYRASALYAARQARGRRNPHSWGRVGREYERLTELCWQVGGGNQRWVLRLRGKVGARADRAANAWRIFMRRVGRSGLRPSARGRKVLRSWTAPGVWLPGAASESPAR